MYKDDLLLCAMMAIVLALFYAGYADALDMFQCSYLPF